MIPISLEYAGLKQTLEEWGYANPKMYPMSKAPSTFTLSKAGGDPGAAADIPYDGQVIIYGTLAGMNSGAETIIFKGTRTQFASRAFGQRSGTDMIFSDAWYQLQRTPFQHHWQFRAPGGGLTTQYFSRINLFQDISAGPAFPWSYLTADNQLREIITFAHTNCGIPVLIGTIDPAWNCPIYGVQGVSCAEAILAVLKTIRDCATWFDYTTNPPTLHMRQRPNLTAKTMPYDSVDGHGRYHKSTNIKPRPDLQASQVVFQYQQTNEIDTHKYTYWFNDAYPGGSGGNAPGAIVVPIDLRGGTRTNVKGNVTAIACDPTLPAFWKTHKPDLARPVIVFDATTPIINTAINDGSPDCITIKDSAGANVSLADFPNEMGPGGEVTPWMTAGGTPITAKEVTITAVLKYVQNLPATAVKEHSLDKHPISVRVKLTNSAAGTVNYSALSHFDPAETVPAGLAENVYNSLATLQWEGDHVIVEKDTYEIIGPWNVLNIAGGSANADWAAMNATVTSVEIDFFSGTTTIGMGPAKHLTPSEYFNLIMMWAWRRVYDNPNLRNTAQDETGGEVALGTDNAKENTNHGIPDQSLLTVKTQPDGSSHQVVLQKDATNGQILMQTTDAAGANVPAQPKIVAKLSDIGALAGVGRIAKFRTAAMCDVSGAQKTVYVLMTAPE